MIDMLKFILILLALVAVLSGLSSPVLAQIKMSPESICIEGDTRPCGVNVGECKYGVSICRDGEWSTCEGGVQAVSEICGNGKDDNCNGLVDECLTELWPILIILGVLFMITMVLLIKMGF